MDHSTEHESQKGGSPIQPMTAEELCQRPDDDQRHELLLGCLLTEPPTNYVHGGLVTRISALLAQHVGSGESGRVLTGDVGFILARSPDTVRAPDIAFLSKRRIDEAGALTAFVPGPPDLAIEVLSPSERSGTIHGKVADYLAAGSRLVWVVDPRTRSVSVYRSLFSPSVLTGDQELDGEDVVSGFRVPVATIFEGL